MYCYWRLTCIGNYVYIDYLTTFRSVKYNKKSHSMYSCSSKEISFQHNWEKIKDRETKFIMLKKKTFQSDTSDFLASDTELYYLTAQTANLCRKLYVDYLSTYHSVKYNRKKICSMYSCVAQRKLRFKYILSIKVFCSFNF